MSVFSIQTFTQKIDNHIRWETQYYFFFSKMHFVYISINIFVCRPLDAPLPVKKITYLTFVVAGKAENFFSSFYWFSLNLWYVDEDV